MNNWRERFINKVTCGDCLELLKELPANSVDLIVTDPPYNINKEFANDNLKEKEFKKFHKTYLNELKRIIKPHKPILIFFNNGENLADFINIVSKILKFKKLIMMYKPNDCSFPLISVLRTSEALLLCVKEGSINYESEINIHDVLICNHTRKEHWYHPTAKNKGIIETIIRAFSLKNALVLDCFLGSGTTAVACKQLNRDFIGFEINPDYCRIAEKRLANVPEKLRKWFK